MASPRILIMAGGTGGHIFPALAVARALMARGADVRWLGTRQGLESKIIPQEKIAIEWITVSGLRGKGAVSWLTAPFKLFKALFQAVKVIRNYQPNVVLGMGGFASGPGGLAAWILRKPLLIHEQNAISGLTNKILAPLAVKVIQAFPAAFAKRSNVITTGNPVRDDIASLQNPEQRLLNRVGSLRVLVVGGSLGAQVFNESIPQAVAQLPESERPELWHQTGERHLESAKSCYEQLGVSARVEPFVENMAEAYAWSDVVICRAGALTVSELAAAGAASILVPFPFAVDDHQTANAKYLSEHNAAILLSQDQFTSEALLELLCKYSGLEGRKELQLMAAAARALAKTDATERVMQMCLEEAHV